MHKYFSIILVLIIAAKICAQQNIVLEEDLQRVLISENLTGAVWSVLSDNEITTGALGLKNADLKEPLKPENRVLIGSVTKVLIATGILRLSNLGKLDIDSPVIELLPNIKFNNPWGEMRPVSIRDLLNHTSGIEDARFWQIFSTRVSSNTPLESVFTKDPSLLKIRTKPGSRFSYSNMGYTLLGLIIEKVTGESYENYLDVNLLSPIGMKNSTFKFVSQKGVHTDPNLAMGHFDHGRTQENLPMFLRPAGQFTTTAKDMALLAKFLLGDGIINDESFIDKELLNQMGKPVSLESYQNGLSSGYQFGLSYRDRHGVLGYFHRGNTIGYRATFYLFPEQKKAFFISFNTDSETADYERFNTVFINYLGIQKPEKLKVEDNLPSNIEEFEGYYKMNPVRFKMFAYLDLVFNSIKVKIENKELIISSIQSKSYSLLPVGNNLFRKEDRIKASHVLYNNDITSIISDGLVTYEKISLIYLVLLWLNLLLGLMGILIIIFRGIYLLYQKKLFKNNQIITFPFLSVLGLLIPVPFLLNQSFLNIGDLTFPNVLLAIVTGFLPIAMIFGISKNWKNKALKVDLIGVLFTLQFILVLIYWGLVPFILWI